MNGQRASVLLSLFADQLIVATPCPVLPLRLLMMLTLVGTLLLIVIQGTSRR